MLSYQHNAKLDVLKYSIPSFQPKSCKQEICLRVTCQPLLRYGSTANRPSTVQQSTFRGWTMSCFSTYSNRPVGLGKPKALGEVTRLFQDTLLHQ